MSRHASEAKSRANEAAAETETFSLVESMIADAEEGTMSPRAMDMAVGMVRGREGEMASQGMGGLLGKAIGKAIGVGVPGIGAATDKALSAAVSSVPDNPESKYGAAVARSQMENNMAQDAAEGVAAATMGPALGLAVGMANAGINARSTANIGRLGEATGISSPSPSSPNSVGSGGGGTASSAKNAFGGSSVSASRAPQGKAFGWSPVDIKKYRSGLIRSNTN